MFYVGDPCYLVDDDERWDYFCKLTFAKESLARAKEYGGGDHVDSVINFEGQELVIWSNGGDGTWAFSGLESANGATSFGVDAGIFCVIDLDNFKAEDDPAKCGILFEHKPELCVEDGVVYIRPRASNGRLLPRVHDDSVIQCDNYRCNRIIHHNEYMSCQYGNCDDGCDSCFECSCCDECGESDKDCSCGEEE